MKRSVLIVAIAAAALVAGASGAAGTRAQVIPKRVQQTIEGRYPRLAYGPSWLPSDYRFAGYFPGRKSFQVAFKTPRYPDALTWSVRAVGKHACARAVAAGVMKRFTLNSKTVYWGGTYGDQDAFRCIKREIFVDASASVPGDSKLNTPRRRHDAFVLAKAVAYATPLN